MIVSVGDVNDHSPVFSEPVLHFVVTENLPPEALVGQLTVKDDDQDLLELSIQGNFTGMRYCPKLIFKVQRFT